MTNHSYFERRIDPRSIHKDNLEIYLSYCNETDCGQIFI